MSRTGRMAQLFNHVAGLPIREAFLAGSSLDQVQTMLKCGTSSGSCVPELMRLAAQWPKAASVA